MHRIIGIDPGLSVTGWAVVDKDDQDNLCLIDKGFVSTKKNDSISSRLLSINSILNSVIEKYNPSAASLEKVFVNNNALSSMLLCYARGAIILTLSIRRINLLEFSPNQVKMSITGFGHSDKSQIRKMLSVSVSNYDSFMIQKDDESDAIAIAVCGLVQNFV